MKNVSDKFAENNQTHILHSITFFFHRKLCRLWHNVEKNMVKQDRRQYNTAHELCMVDNQGCRHTPIMCNTYSFSTATRLLERASNFRLCVHWLTCFFTYHNNRPFCTLILLLPLGIVIHYDFIVTVVAGGVVLLPMSHRKPRPDLNGPWTRPNLNHKTGSRWTSFRIVPCSTEKVHDTSSSETSANVGSTFFTSYSLELV